MKRILTLCKIEGKLALRCPDGLLFGVVMPVGVLFLISIIGGNQNAAGSDMTFLQSAFASLLTVGICATAFMGLPLTFADYRDKKILKHYFVTPVHPRILLLVQAIIAALTAILSACMIALCSILFFNYHMEGNLLWFVLAYLLVLVSMYSIGFIIAALCPSVKIANVVSSMIYFPMLFLSGASIPYELFPGVLQRIADILPLTHGIKLLKAISMNTWNQQVIASILILSAITIIGYVISIRYFRWK